MERQGSKQLSDWVGGGDGRVGRLAFVLDVSANSIWAWASERRVPDAVHQRMLRLVLGIPEDAWFSEADHAAILRCSSELERGALAA